MQDNQMIVISEKESFLVRVLVGKAQDARIRCEYVPLTTEDIGKKLDGVKLITMYMDDKAFPDEDIIHYLVDAMEAGGQQIIIIGEERDIQSVSSHMPRHLVYELLPRPVDNSAYLKSVTEYFDKVENGDFQKSILVVDDDPSYLGLVREWLKDSYKVYMVSSGLQAIKWLGKNTVDLILLDHEMPVTSGPQVLEMLRSEEETRKIPVMFLTGKSDKDSVMKVVSLKPEGYFLKTIQREELLEKLKEFFILHK